MGTNKVTNPFRHMIFSVQIRIFIQLLAINCFEPDLQPYEGSSWKHGLTVQIIAFHSISSDIPSNLTPYLPSTPIWLVVGKMTFICRSEQFHAISNKSYLELHSCNPYPNNHGVVGWKHEYIEQFSKPM